MNSFLVAAIVGISLAFTAGVKHFWPKYPDDNVVEETAEQYIKDVTNVDIELTPNSPEKKN